jgi:hypothetical protein
MLRPKVVSCCLPSPGRGSLMLFSTAIPLFFEMIRFDVVRQAIAVTVLESLLAEHH